MTEQMKNPSRTEVDSAKITICRNGPYIVAGGVPLTISEICNDDEGYCRTWREVKRYTVQEKYALCRCGQSENKPFCDGTHSKIQFDGTEAGDHEPFDKAADVICGPALTLADNRHLCVHARFCMRAGGIWNLVDQSDDHEARDIAIEEACNCPSGRLVVRDNESGKTIESPNSINPLSLSNILPGVSMGRFGCAAASQSNLPMANCTKSGIGSPSAGAEDRRTNRFVMAAILKDKLDIYLQN